MKFKKAKISHDAIKFGWWVKIDEVIVATLDYRTYDVDSQFWHLYLLTVLDEKFDDIGYDADKWCEKNVILQNRFATSFCQKGVLVSFRIKDHILIRGLDVPNDVYLSDSKSHVSLVTEY